MGGVGLCHDFADIQRCSSPEGLLAEGFSITLYAIAFTPFLPSLTPFSVSYVFDCFFHFFAVITFSQLCFEAVTGTDTEGDLEKQQLSE